MVQVAAVELMTTSERREASLSAATTSGRHLTSYDDDALMARAQDGDKEAFEALVDRHTNLVVSITSRFLGDRAAGHDVAQEVFLDLWLSRLRYHPDGRFRRYLATLTLNRCRDATRRSGSEQRRRDGLAAQGEPRQRDPADHAIDLQSSRLLQAALADIDPADRELLVMRYGLDMAYDEIAEELGRPAGTLRSRVFHSLRKLRKLLEGES